MRIAITVVTITALSAISLTACGNNKEPKAAASTPTASASPTYDGSTVSACKEADQTGESKDKDFRHAKAARRFAELSGVPTLRAVAEKYPADPGADETGEDLQALAAAAAISSWCLQHHIEQ